MPPMHNCLYRVRVGIKPFKSKIDYVVSIFPSSQHHMAAAVWAPMQMSCACVPGRGTAVIKHRYYHNHILLTVYTTSSEGLFRNPGKACKPVFCQCDILKPFSS